MKAEDIIKKTRKFCVETTYAYPLVIKSGFGCYLEDVENRLFLDFNSNVCSCAVGYNHPEIVDIIRSFVGTGAHKMAGQDFYCFPEGTLIVGEEVKPIEEVKVGDKVFTHKGRLRKVTKIYKRYYEGPLVKITPHGNNPIFLTPEHPIMVKGLTKIDSKSDRTKVRYKIQWRRALDIVRKLNKNRADMLHIPVPVKNNYKYLGNEKERIKLTPDVMRFIGYYLSEGHIHQGRTIVFSFNKNEEEFMSDVQMIAKNEFNANSSLSANHRNGMCVNVFSSKLARIFKNEFGMGATKKRIPQKILLLNDKKLILELIKGYWRGDGTLKSKQCTAMTASRNLAHHLRMLLTKLGIFLSIYYLPPQFIMIDGREGLGKGGYGMYIPLKFKENFESMINTPERFCDGGKKLPIDFLYNSKKFTKHISMTIDHKHRFNFWVRIRKKEIVENFKGFVLNLEVEEDNSYLVDGFSVHNCKEQADLAEELIRIVPKNLSKVLFVNTGAEAVENAIKFAFRRKGPLPGVSCTGAFHGRTIGALTFTDSKAVQKKNYPEINHEVIKFCTLDNDPEINGLHDLIEREWIPAFVIVECVQGEGGYNIASKKFIQNLRKTSKEHNFPLIVDEVQTGLGRTGKWWSFEHFGIKPDIFTTAKALQVGAVVSSKEYDPKEPGAVSSTWGGGHRIDMAIGLKTIEIIKNENLLENATKIGNHIIKRLKEMKNKYPIITDVRGLGLMIGVEFSKEIYKDLIPKIAFRKGLLLLGCGKKNIRITPPLTITRDEADKGLEIFEDILKHLKKNYSA